MDAMIRSIVTIVALHIFAFLCNFYCFVRRRDFCDFVLEFRPQAKFKADLAVFQRDAAIRKMPQSNPK